MAAGHAAILSLLVTALTMTSYHYSSRNRASSSASNGRNLTVYAMGVGQGDGNIILCPNGRDILIVDMGAKISQYTDRSYGGYLLKEKFKVLEKRMNIHIIVTHTDEDHYNFLPKSFADEQLLERVREVVIGNKFDKYGKTFKKWVNNAQKMPPVYTVNNGTECFGNSDCDWTLARPGVGRTSEDVISFKGDPWQFCGNDVTVTVLGANICIQNKKYPERCTSDNSNARSIVMKLEYKDWSLFLSGDFEGVHQQEKLIGYWSRINPFMLQSTYYKVSHHGAWTSKQANSVRLLEAVSPKRAYISHGHPITTFCVKYIHPRCEVLDNLISLGTIERVNTSPDDSALVCWQDLSNSRGQLERRDGYAIYETCRGYDLISNNQICHDILITTDGLNDHTSYVDVPHMYVHNKSSSSSTTKSSCSKGREEMKNELLDLFPLSLLL